MTEQEVAALLEKLARAERRMADVDADFEKEVEKVIPAAVRRQLKLAERDHDAAAAPVRSKIEALRARVKDACVEHGATVTAEGYQAVYVKAPIRYLTERLEGLRAAYPAIDAARTVGEPSCSIRKVKE